MKKKVWTAEEEKSRVRMERTQRRAGACLQLKHPFILGEEEEECWCCKGLMHSLSLQGRPLPHVLLSANNLAKNARKCHYGIFSTLSREEKGIVGAEATMAVFKGEKRNRKNTSERK